MLAEFDLVGVWPCVAAGEVGMFTSHRREEPPQVRIRGVAFLIQGGDGAVGFGEHGHYDEEGFPCPGRVQVPARNLVRVRGNFAEAGMRDSWLRAFRSLG